MKTVTANDAMANTTSGMEKTTLEIVEQLLSNVQAEVDDPELSYKLRTARQLIVLVSEQHEAGRNALTDADLDPETLEQLRRLGYLD